MAKPFKGKTVFNYIQTVNITVCPNSEPGISTNAGYFIIQQFAFTDLTLPLSPYIYYTLTN